MPLNINLYKTRLDAYKVGGKDGKINSMKKQILDDFLSNPSHCNVLINNAERDVHIVSEGQKGLRLLCKPNEDIIEGEYIIWDNQYFLCTYRFSDDKVQTKTTIQKCNHNLQYINKNNQLITKPCIEDARTLYTTGVKDEKIIEIPNGMVGIQLPNDEDTRLIDRGDSFIFNKTKYEVTFYDHVTYQGLVVLICTEVSEKITEADDMENEIANRYIIENGIKIDRLVTEPEIPTEPEPNPTNIAYTITAKTVYPSDPDDEIYWNDTVIYTVHKFDNDVEVDGNFTFEVYQQNIKTKEWIQPSSISEVTNTTNNTINIKAIELKQGYIKLVATDTETNQIAIEKQIKIRGVM